MLDITNIFHKIRGTITIFIAWFTGKRSRQETTTMRHRITFTIPILLNIILLLTAKAEAPSRPEIVWSGIWYFTPGTRNLSDDELPERASRFRLDGSEIIDLDTLLPAAGKTGDEGVLFTELEASHDGEAVLGIGCDWWFQAFLNGRECASTWEAGNGSGLYAAWNNPFPVEVKAGKNRLKIRVRRGSASWRFCCGTLNHLFRISPPAMLRPGAPAGVSAQKRSGSSSRFLILGDTHYDALPEVYHADYREPNAIQREEFARNAEMWETRCPALLKAAATHRNPETAGVIQVGDLVQGDCGNPLVHAQMLADAREKLKSQFGSLPLLTVLGNHDIRGQGMGAVKAGQEFFLANLAEEWGQNAAGTTHFFLLNDALFLLIDFNSPDVETILKAFEEHPDARYKFVITHGPVLPADTPGNRWMLFGDGNDFLRRWMRELFLKHDVIVLTGHVHEMSLTECRTETGRITQLMVNSVW